MSDEDPRPPVDNVGFNDPGAWGFCDFCAFEVSIIDGLRVEHQRYRTGSNDEMCIGGGRPPAGPTPVEATPRMQVDLRKPLSRAQRRGYWARQRQASRRMQESKRAAEIKIQPSQVLVTNLETGVEVDMTDQIIGPILLNTEDSDGRVDVAE